MKVRETAIAGAILLFPDVLRDERGFFMETYHDRRYAEFGIDLTFRQDNRSLSSRGVLRGLHYQVAQPQGHLVMVLAGEIFDVGLDLRRGSPTFGQAMSMVLKADDFSQLWLPPGVAHGFCVLSETGEIHYKCSDLYAPGDEAGVLWNDPDLAIDWPIDSPVIAPRDQKLPRLRDVPENRLPTAPFR